MKIETADQLGRLKKKLAQAKQIDNTLSVFGAKSHKYHVGPPASADEISAFEQQYDVTLPECYAAFVTGFGNGGVSYHNSAAGPFYGIYPLGTHLTDFARSAPALYNKCILYPDMTGEYWEELTKALDNDDTYEQTLDTIYGGILPLGSQGCSSYHGLVLNGQYVGKVVNFDLDGGAPRFSFDDTFLDWYERWLDEIISGDLLQKGVQWFGYSRGGSAEHLLEQFLSAPDDHKKLEYLSGIEHKATIPAAVQEGIERVYQTSSGTVKKGLLQTMTKFDYQRAKPHLQAFAETDLCTVCQFVFWYAKPYCNEWSALIQDNLPRVNDDETFQFCFYVLKEAGADCGPLIVPFTKHTEWHIRQHSYYLLGTLSNKAQYLDLFIQGLHDEEPWVVHATLQALRDLKDKRLPSHYRSVAERFPAEANYKENSVEHYIVSNLDLRLKEYSTNNKPRWHF
jgi:hypothetical protein